MRRFIDQGYCVTRLCTAILSLQNRVRGAYERTVFTQTPPHRRRERPERQDCSGLRWRVPTGLLENRWARSGNSTNTKGPRSRNDGDSENIFRILLSGNLGNRVFEQGNLRQKGGRSNIHFNATEIIKSLVHGLRHSQEHGPAHAVSQRPGRINISQLEYTSQREVGNAR